MSEAELIGRLEKLERDNRRLKRGGFALLVMLAAMATIYASRPVPQKVTAHEFDVVDDAGRAQIKLSTTPRGLISSIKVLDAQGNRAASISVFPWASYVTVGKDGGDIAQITGGMMGSYVGVVQSQHLNAALAGKSGKALREAVKSSLTRLESEASVSMGLSPSGRPGITVRDAQGYSMDVGSTSTITPATGQTQNTSADSIIMFGNGKKHHVIWQAP